MQVKNEKLYSNSAIVGLSQVNSQEAEKEKDVQLQSDTISMMNYLKEKYRNLNFNFSSFENRNQISQYGATQKGTNNVTISQELLEKMSQDENLRNTVEDVLNHMSDYQKSAQVEALLCNKELVGMGLVIGEDGQVLKWMATQEKDKESLYPPSWRDRESSSFYSKAKKKKNSTSTYNYSHSNNMMRLAGARNVPAVRGLIATKYAEMQKVRSQVSDPAEAAAIIRKIKGFIQNGNIKIARLHKEENLALQQKSAEKKMKEKLALQLARELSRKRRARMGQEQCQTAHLDDVMPKSSLNDEQFRQIAEQYANFLSPIDSSSGGTVDTTAGGTVDVSVMNAPVATVVDCSA